MTNRCLEIHSFDEANSVTRVFTILMINRIKYDNLNGYILFRFGYSGSYAGGSTALQN